MAVIITYFYWHVSPLQLSNSSSGKIVWKYFIPPGKQLSTCLKTPVWHSSRSGRTRQGVGKCLLPHTPKQRLSLCWHLLNPHLRGCWSMCFFSFFFFNLRDTVATAVIKPTGWTRNDQKCHISSRNPSTHKVRLLKLRQNLLHLGLRPPPPHVVPRRGGNATGPSALPLAPPSCPQPLHRRVLQYALALPSF